MTASRILFVTTALLFALLPLSRASVYIKAAGLYNRPNDIEVSNASAFKASLENNVGFSAALGYKLSLLRLEAEGQFLRNRAESDTTSGTLLGGFTRTAGTIKESTGFVNALVDLPTFFRLTPYIGAGVGYARVDVDGLMRTRNNAPLVQFSGRDSVFGYQGMLGVQLRLFGAATINAGYRMAKREDIAVHEVIGNARQNLSLGTTRMFELGFALGF